MPPRPGLALLRAAQPMMPASRMTSSAIGIRSSNASIAVQHGADGEACAIAAIAGSCATSNGAACSAGVATITAANGSSATEARNHAPSTRRSASTRLFQWTANGCAIALTTAFMPGVPTQASSPAPGHGATTPAACHSVTAAVKCWSRVVKYCAPWSNATSPDADATRRVAIRPPAPRPLSNTVTTHPARWSVSAQERPAMPAPTMPILMPGVFIGRPIRFDSDLARDRGHSSARSPASRISPWEVARCQ
ncbi:hypothetical protein ACVWYO_002041 [Sphingomonas sp. UYP23]